MDKKNGDTGNLRKSKNLEKLRESTESKTLRRSKKSDNLLRENKKINLSEIQVQKVIAYLGFSSKSGKIVYGKDMLREYITDQRIKTKVILMATDVGPRVKKDIQIRCKINNIPIVQIFSKYQLSKAVGLREVSVIGIADENLAKSIIDVLNLIEN